MTDMENSPKARNYGIDLLRIFAMYLVAVLHVLGRGGILANADSLSINYEAAWLLETAAYCAVNCYALISGYVNYGAKFKLSNLAVIWLNVLFYTLGITAIFALLRPEALSPHPWLRALTPVMSSEYWYVNAYFCLFAFIPVLNYAVRHIPQKQMRAVIIMLAAVFTVLQTPASKDLFGTVRGYSGLWLMVLYLIGAYIRKYDALAKVTKLRSLILYAAAVAVSWLFKLAVEAAGAALPDESGRIAAFVSSHAGDLIEYTSPTILAAAVFIMSFFLKLKIGTAAKKIIAFLAPSAFSVYLIHVNGLVWDNIMLDRFVNYAWAASPIVMLAKVVLAALGLYLFCTAADMPRRFIFSRTALSSRLHALERRLTGDLWNE